MDSESRVGVGETGDGGMRPRFIRQLTHLCFRVAKGIWEQAGLWAKVGFGAASMVVVMERGSHTSGGHRVPDIMHRGAMKSHSSLRNPDLSIYAVSTHL